MEHRYDYFLGGTDVGICTLHRGLGTGVARVLNLINEFQQKSFNYLIVKCKIPQYQIPNIQPWLYVLTEMYMVSNHPVLQSYERISYT